ncbi:YtzH-like family protein [Paucisalibacillus globulus]|jgi:predicted O-linked N-acetylglucosamine transferase (SPINDLY family)|uniref:YtzH-like family protein n=1 Tax=Paucisalibacillus globulus TaxID=351095 RepID=UPI000BB88426|nr:YtzH-like family protein [Paucisalibacillus globulus]
MSLTVNNQLELLMDLLDEQQSECCAQISEYQQIKRLVKSMMANNTITDEQLLQLLPEIYNYGRQGESVQNHEEHITSNKDNINNWISAIEQTNLQ